MYAAPLGKIASDTEVKKKSYADDNNLYVVQETEVRSTEVSDKVQFQKAWWQSFQKYCATVVEWITSAYTFIRNCIDF